MCNDESKFKTMSSFTGSYNVRQFDGHVPVTKCGTLDVEVDGPNGKATIELEGVLYMPSLPFNIYSLVIARKSDLYYDCKKVPGKIILQEDEVDGSIRQVAIFTKTAGRWTLDCQVVNNIIEASIDVAPSPVVQDHTENIEYTKHQLSAEEQSKVIFSICTSPQVPADEDFPVDEFSDMPDLYENEGMEKETQVRVSSRLNRENPSSDLGHVPPMARETKLDDVQPSSKEAIRHTEVNEWLVSKPTEGFSPVDTKILSVVVLSTANNVIKDVKIHKMNGCLLGALQNYKSRVIARGLMQISGVDYSDNYSPIVRTETISKMLVFETTSLHSNNAQTSSYTQQISSQLVGLDDSSVGNSADTSNCSLSGP